MERYNSLSDKQDRKTSSMKAKNKHPPANSDVDYVEYDNDNMSPLYSNWDQVGYAKSNCLGFLVMRFCLLSFTGDT